MKKCLTVIFSVAIFSSLAVGPSTTANAFGSTNSTCGGGLEFYGFSQGEPVSQAWTDADCAYVRVRQRNSGSVYSWQYGSSGYRSIFLDGFAIGATHGARATSTGSWYQITT